MHTARVVCILPRWLVSMHTARAVCILPGQYAYYPSQHLARNIYIFRHCWSNTTAELALISFPLLLSSFPITPFAYNECSRSIFMKINTTKIYKILTYVCRRASSLQWHFQDWSRVRDDIQLILPHFMRQLARHLKLNTHRATSKYNYTQHMLQDKVTHATLSHLQHTEKHLRYIHDKLRQIYGHMTQTSATVGPPSGAGQETSLVTAGQWARGHRKVAKFLWH